MSRPTWTDTFFALADVWARRATCPRLHVGAVLVNRDHQVLAAGYNGSLRHTEHCTDVGCLMVDHHCLRAVHGELNAIAQAARTGTSLLEATAYITHLSCLTCAKALVQAGIRTIHYGRDYPSQGADVVREVLAHAGVWVGGPYFE